MTNTAYNEWSKAKQVTVQISDSLSGLEQNARFRYGWSTTESTEPTKWNEITVTGYARGTESTTFKVVASPETIGEEQPAGKYYLWLEPVNFKDISISYGNSQTEGIKSPKRYWVDAQIPSVTFGAEENETWSQDHQVTVTIFDGYSGLANGTEMEYQWVVQNADGTEGTASEDEWTSTGVLVNDSSKPNSATFTVTESTLTGKYYLWLRPVSVKDTSVEGGNVLSTDTIIKTDGVFWFDNTKPQLNMTSTEGSTTWSKTHTAEFEIVDLHSGLAEGIEIVYGWSTSTSIVPTTWLEPTIEYSEGANNTTFIATAEGLTGKYYLWVKQVTIEDVAQNYVTGGTITKYSQPYYLDNTAPRISIVEGIETDGLIRYYNAENNTGDGHSSTSTTWKDLSGNYDATITSGTFESDHLVISGGEGSIDAGNLGQLTEYTIQMKLNATEYFDFEINTNNGNDYTNFYGGGPDEEYYYLIGYYKFPCGYQASLEAENPWDPDEILDVAMVWDGTHSVKYYVNGELVEEDGERYNNDGHTCNWAPEDITFGDLIIQNYDDNESRINSIIVYDRALPQEEIQKNAEATQTTTIVLDDEIWSKNKELTVKVIDNHSGLAEGAQLKYGWSTSKTTEPTTWNTVNVTGYTEGATSAEFLATASTITIGDEKAAGKYYLWVEPVELKDISVEGGNSQTEGEQSDRRYWVDNKEPTISFNQEQNETWSKQHSVTVTIADPHSGLATGTKLQYQWVEQNADGTIGTPSAAGWKSTTVTGYEAETNSTTFTITENTLTGKYYLFVKPQVVKDTSKETVTATEAAGNILSTEEVINTTGTFWFDNTKPLTIDIEPEGNTTWSKEHSATITLSDLHSGLATGAQIMYGWSTSLTTGPAADQTFTTTVTGYTAGANTATFTATGSGLNGKYYLWVQQKSIKDAAGNVLPASQIVKSTQTFYFDNQLPEISIDPQERNVWAKEHSVTVTIADALSGLQENAEIQYQWVRESDEGVAGTATDDGWTQATVTGYTAGASSATYTITGMSEEHELKGKYHLWLKVVNVRDISVENGNEIVSDTIIKTTGTFWFDYLSPTITLVQEENTTWSKSHTVTVKIRDEHCGLAEGAQVKYGWSLSQTDEPSNYTTVDLTGYTEGTTEYREFTVTESELTGKYYLWVVPITLKDTVGNELVDAKKSTGTFYFDNVRPTISFEPNTSGTSYYKNTPEVVVTISDVDSGLTENVSIEYMWATSAEDTLEGTWTTVSGTNQVGATSTTRTIPSLDNGFNGEYYLYIKEGTVVDNVADSSTENSNLQTNSEVFHFDNNKPTITLTPNKQDTKWTNGAEVTVTAVDTEAGLAPNQTLQYQWVKSDITEPKEDGWREVSPNTSPTEIITDGLVRYYDGLNNTGSGHDNTATKWKDLSGNYDANIREGTSWGDSYLTTDKEYISIGRIPTTQANTFEVTFKIDEYTEQISYLMYMTTPGNLLLQITAANNPKFHITTTDGTITTIQENITLEKNKIYTVTGTVDGTKIKMYLDGVLVAEREYEDTYTYDEGKQRYGCIAGRYNNDRGFDGNIYSARVYNKALTQEEIIQNLIAERKALQWTIPKEASSTLTGWYKLFIKEGTIKDNVLDDDKNTNNQVESGVFLLDGRKPELIQIIPDEGNTTWSRQHTATIALEDLYSGFSKYEIEYQWVKEGETADSDGWVTATESEVIEKTNTSHATNRTVKYEITKNGLTGKYNLLVRPKDLKDNCGNILEASEATTTKSTGTFYFDNTAPTLSVNGQVETWKKAHAATITLEDPLAGLDTGAQIQYQWVLENLDGTPGTPSTEGWSDSVTVSGYTAGTNNATFIVNKNDYTFTGKYHLWVRAVNVKDTSVSGGNETSTTTEIRSEKAFWFDNTKPTATLTPNNNTDYVKGGTAITVTMNDEHSGLIANAKIQYQWVLKGETADENNWEQLVATNTSTLGADGTNEVTWTVPASASSNLNGIYNLYIRSGITQDNVLDSTKNTNEQKVSGDFYFDNKAVEITINPNSRDWSRAGTTVEITIDDSNSGSTDVAGLPENISIQYQWVEEGATVSNTWKTATGTNTLGQNNTTRSIQTEGTNGIYYLYIKEGISDRLGNVTTSQVVSQAFKFDNTKPQVTFEPNEQVVYSKQGAQVNVTLSDSLAGLAENVSIQYQWVKGDAEPTSAGWSSAVTGTNAARAASTVRVVPQSASEGFTGIYYLYIKAGTVADDVIDTVKNTNDQAKSGAFYFDNTETIIEFSDAPTSWVTGSAVTVTATDSDAGLKANAQIQYQWATSEADLTDANWATLTATNAAKANTVTWTVPKSASENQLNGQYYLYIKDGLQDFVGNSTSAKAVSQQFKFDNTKPVVTLDPMNQEYYTKAGREITVTIEDTLAGLTQNVAIQFQWATSSSALSSSGWVIATGTNAAGAASTTRVIPAAQSEGLTGEYFLFIKEGSVRDNVTDTTLKNINEQKQSEAFHFDNARPIISFEPNEATPADGFYRKTPQVVVTIADLNAGLAENVSIQYQWATSSSALSDDNWTTVTGTNAAAASSTTRTVPVIDAGFNGDYYLYVRENSVRDNIVDSTTENANVLASSAVFHFDNTKPTITLTPDEQSTSWSRGTQVTVTGTDNQAGFIANAKIQYQWVLNGNSIDDNAWTELDAGNAARANVVTWTIAKEITSTFNGEYKLYIKSGVAEDNVLDNPKNTNDQVISGTFLFDNEKPRAVFGSEANPYYYKGGADVLVRVRDEYAGLIENAVMQYQWVLDGEEPDDSSWSAPVLAGLSGEGNTAGVHQVEYVVPTTVSDQLTGDYRLYIKAGVTKDNITDADKNTNEQIISDKYYFDNTKPIVQFNPIKQDEWTIEGAEVELTISDVIAGLAENTVVEYQWAQSEADLTTNWIQTTNNVNAEAAASSKRIVPASSSEGLTGVYYLFIRQGCIKDNVMTVEKNENDLTVSEAFHFDNTAPEYGTLSMKIENTSGSDYTDDTWINKTICIQEINGIDGHSGHQATTYTVEEQKINVDGTLGAISTLYQDKSGITYLDPGEGASAIYTITVTTRDNLGNEAVNPHIYTVKIDKVLPTAGTLIMKLEDASGDDYPNDVWVNKSVYIAKEDGSDTISGHQSTVYNVIKDGEVYLSNQTEPTTLTDTGVYEITVTTTDFAGNTASNTYTVRIDKVLPEGTVHTDGILMTNEPTITVYVEDVADTHSGLRKVSIGGYFAPEGTSGGYAAANEAIYDEENDRYYYTLAFSDLPNRGTGGKEQGTGPYTLYSAIVDNAINSYYPSIQVLYDIINPIPGTLEMKLQNSTGSDYTDNTWTNQSVYIAKVDGSDEHSGHQTTTYTVTKDGEEYITDKSEPTTLTETGVYEITVTTRDKVGNVATNEHTYIVKIDKILPSGVISSGVDMTKDPTVTIYIDDVLDTGGSGVDVDNIRIIGYFGETFVTEKSERTPSYDEENDRYYYTFTFSQIPNTSTGQVDQGTGIYSFYAIIPDVAGNRYVNTPHIQVLYDITNPLPGTLTMKLDNAEGRTYADSSWTSHDVYINVIDGSDAHSGHQLTKYSVLKDDVIYLEDQTGEITLTETGVYKITVTTIDNVGNSADRNYIVAIDKQLPVAGTLTMKQNSSSGSDYTEDTWTNQSIYIAKVNGSDARSGHLKTTYEVTKDGRHFASDQTEYMILEDEGVYIVTVTTEDKSGTYYSEDGNKASRAYVIKIDKTTPEAIITGTGETASVVTDGLIRHYNAHNNTGNGHDGTVTTWKDLSGNYDATVNGGATFGENYLTLDGTDDWVNMGEITVTNAVTVEATVKFNSLGLDGKRIYLITNAQNRGIILRYDTKLTYRIRINPESDYEEITLNEELQTNRIYNIAATYDGNSIKLYIDGVLKGEKEAIGTIKNPNNNTVMAIGANPNGNEIEATSLYANVDVYTTRIYEKALTIEELNQNIKADGILITKSTGGAGVTDGLIRHYSAHNNLGNGHSSAATTWKDLSGNYDAQVHGGTFTDAYITLDGTNDCVNMGEINVNNAVTLEASIKINDSQSGTRFIMCDHEVGGVGLLLVNGKPQIKIYIQEAGEYKIAQLNEVLDTNRIYNISGTYDGTSLKLYIDGVLQAETPVTGTIKKAESNAKMMLGAQYDPSAENNASNFTNINVYSARVYERALTQAEIKQNLNADRISPEKLMANDEEVKLSFIFSEGVSGFDASDIELTNGTKGTFTKVSDSEYTLQVTGITAQADLVAKIKENSYVDKASNNGNAPSTTRTRDTISPSVTITANPDESPTKAETITYTFTFSEPTVGFTIDDVQVTNGTKGTFTKVNSSKFTLVVTNERTYLQTITVPAGVTNDDSGNLNITGTKSVIIDRTTPTITATPDKTTNAQAEDGKAVTSQSVTIVVDDMAADEEEDSLQSGLNPSNVYEYYLSQSATTLAPAQAGATWTTYTSGTPFTIGTGLTGTYHLFVKTVSDKVGNVSQETGTMVEIEGVTYHLFGEYVFDNSSPTVLVVPDKTTNESVDDGKAVTEQELLIRVTEIGTAGFSSENVYEYYLSASETELVPAQEGATWTAYRGSEPFTIGTGLTGTYYLFVKPVADSVGNISTQFGELKTIGTEKYHMFGEFVFDNTMPDSIFEPEENKNYQKSQSSKVTLTDIGTAGVDPTTIKYVWTQGIKTEEQATGLLSTYGIAFENGATITKSDGTGNNFYLWITAKDKLGNTYIDTSKEFYLDNTKPTVGEVTKEPSSPTTYTLTISGILDKTGTSAQSGVRGYYISTDPTAPTESTEWAATASTTQMNKWIPSEAEQVIFEGALEDEEYYIWSIDKVGNISNVTEYDTRIIYYELIHKTENIRENGKTSEWFESFEKAVAAAGTGDTIKVVKDVTDETSGIIDKSITLNPNGFTLTKTDSVITVNSGCTLEITGTGTITSELDEIITVNGNLKVTGATIEKTGETAIINKGSGSIEINGSNAKVNGKIYTGSGTTSLYAGTVAGNIYGGQPYAEVETVNIVLNGATVRGNILGGNSAKKVGTANITLKSGNITNGHVFGGNNVETANITVEGMNVNANIYGGGDLVGTVTNANINIKSGTVTGNVYGGSRQGGTVTNANITIQNGATVTKNVYGGGEKATIGTASTNGNITINIVGGTIKGNVYGGSDDQVVYGNTTINIGKDAVQNATLQSGTIIIEGNIYGGGSKSGTTTYTSQSVNGTSNVNINANGHSTFSIHQNIFGSGQNCAVQNSNVTIKNLGTSSSPYQIQSVQRVGTLTIDNSNLEIIGATDEDNSNKDTAFTLNRVGNLKIKNGTTLHLRRGFNQVEEFNSLVDVSGTETKAQVSIENGTIATSNVTNRVYVYEGVNLIIAKQQYNQNVQLTEFGKVNGMTFFGMYARDREDLSLKYDIYDPSSPTNGDLFKLGSYVEGKYDTTGATTVDGFYTNIVDETTSAIKPEYVEVITYQPTYQDWILGGKTYTQDVTMIARRYKEQVHKEVPLNYFNQAGTEYNISLFSINSLEKGVSLVDKDEIGSMASDTEKANTTFALSMASRNEGWITQGETHFYTSDTTPIEGTMTYVTDDSGNVPYFDLYLHNSMNISKDSDCGLVSIIFLVKQTVEGDPTQGGIFKVAITINIQTRQETDLTEFTTESQIAKGKNYELFVGDEIHITERSSMTFYTNVFPVGTYTSTDYRAIVTGAALPVGTEVTMIDYAQQDNPVYYYYQITSGYDAVEDGKYIYKLSNFKLMGTTSGTRNYTNPNTTYASKGFEEYRFIFDFKQATVTQNLLDSIIRLEIRDASTNEAKNNQTTISTFNIYKDKNSGLTLSVTGNASNVYEISNQRTLKFRVESDIIKQIVDGNTIEDTFYDEKKLGISIALYDSSNNRVPYEKMKGTYIEIGEEEYYPDLTGVTRIYLADNIVKVGKNVEVTINSNLIDTGEYKLRIENFASYDGQFYGKIAEKQVDTAIRVIDLDHGLKVEIQDADRLIDATTGKTYDNDTAMNIGIKASDIVSDANIRMTLYRRDVTFNEDLTYAGISYTEVDLQDYVIETLLTAEDKGLISTTDYEYLITNEVSEETLIQLTMNLTNNLPTGGYKLVFGLYGGNTCMGTVERHLVATDLINVE